MFFGVQYACRKTLADNRPRIRGRFARNDEAPGDITKAATFNRYEDEDDLWVINFNFYPPFGILNNFFFFKKNNIFIDFIYTK